MTGSSNLITRSNITSTPFSLSSPPHPNRLSTTSEIHPKARINSDSSASSSSPSTSVTSSLSPSAFSQLSPSTASTPLPILSALPSSPLFSPSLDCRKTCSLSATGYEPSHVPAPFHTSSLTPQSSLNSITTPPPLSVSSSFRGNTPRGQHSQPQTPLPVKETLHGLLSETSSQDGHRQLNQYLLQKTIGRGSYGSVELARDLNSKDSSELYAIKEYSKSRLRKIKNRNSRLLRHQPRGPARANMQNQSDGLQLVKTEIAIMKKLAHQNIVTLFEVIDTDDDSLFFVMELCPFGPIIDLDKQKRDEEKGLSEVKARNLFQQIVLGIEYLHFNEILHLDIKPDNILYFENPELVERPICKIVDFGISEPFQASGDDTLRKFTGSPGFLAPELCSRTGAAVHGKMVDIWAMGITLYSLLCGLLPFQDEDPLELSEKIVNDPVLVPAEFSRDLKILLNRLLDKTPETRITMSELRNDDWLTNYGEEPLPDESMNLLAVEPPSEQEIDQAFKSLWSFATVFKAISKFRSGRKVSAMTNNSIEEECLDENGILRPSFTPSKLNFSDCQDNGGKHEQLKLKKKPGPIDLGPRSIIITPEPIILATTPEPIDQLEYLVCLSPTTTQEFEVSIKPKCELVDSASDMEFAISQSPTSVDQVTELVKAL